MRNKNKVKSFIGNIFDLFLGESFQAPADKNMAKYPNYYIH